ncbi:MAG: HAD family hydrolase [Lachnospiraceae bacterium]
MDLWKDKSAVLFDLDGTLVDSMWMWGEIDREFLGEREIPLPEDLQKTIEGMSFTETAVYFQKRFQLKETVEELKVIWNQMAIQKYRREVPMKPYALDFLQELKNRKIKMGIATSNSAELVEAVMNAHQLNRYIDIVVTACEVAHGKPAPDVYLEAAKRLDVSSENCIVFEDVPMGIRAGKNAGMQVCAVFDEASWAQDAEKKELADAYITSYRDVL